MSSKTKNWTEEDFRRELRHIDEHVKKTQGIELVGAELDITYSQTAVHVLGRYYPREKKFRFSLAFFNSDIPEACAIDVIRHEYAHYYNDVVFGVESGHGKTFKAACKIVGANPKTYYNPAFEKAERLREESLSRTYNSSVSVGQEVEHPVYGAGIVVSLENRRDSALLTVDFGKHGVKKIDEIWLRENGLI